MQKNHACGTARQRLQSSSGCESDGPRRKLSKLSARRGALLCAMSTHCIYNPRVQVVPPPPKAH
jgi:hypothetical protein